MFIPYLLLIFYYVIGIMLFFKIKYDNKRRINIKDSLMIPNDDDRHLINHI